MAVAAVLAQALGCFAEHLQTANQGILQIVGVFQGLQIGDRKAQGPIQHFKDVFESLVVALAHPSATASASTRCRRDGLRLRRRIRSTFCCSSSSRSSFKAE